METTKMICPDCKVEMEQGHLLYQGTRWFKGEQNVISKALAYGTPGLKVITFHCPECGRLELITTSNDKG